MEAHERVTLGKMTHPVRGFLHGIAAVLSLVAMILLVALAPGGVGRRLSLLAFGASLVAMFVTSSLYHSIPWRDVWKKRMQKLDHTMISVLVAGTFTPLAVIVLDGWLQIATLVVQWGLVVVAGIHKTFTKAGRHWISVALSTTQGWLALFILWPMATRIPAPAVVLIALGGVLYTIGMIFLVTGHPRLWPRVFSYHEAFHVLVVLAAATHFVAIAGWVAGYGA